MRKAWRCDAPRIVAAISIIVPAFNEERLLGATLQRINGAASAFVRRGWKVELIVCDNNSTDRTARIAGDFGAKVVFEPVNQIARARNTGAAAATGDWLVFVDADSHPGTELFEEVAQAITSGRVLAGGSTVRLEPGYRKGSWLTQLWNSVSRAFRWVAGSFIFCDAGAFQSLGGFNDRLYAGEEIDFSIRLKKLARTQRRKVMILHRHPILTSARKLHLYTPREHFRFVLRTLLARGKTLTDRASCHTWYDGRR